MSKMWYVLKSKDESIEMRFTDYDLLLKFYRKLPLEQALQCYWEVEE
jgi:hypothetical protein